MPVRVPTICRSLACEQVEAVLISHRYRFIYTKTVKTAGTSVESYFERFCMPEGEWAYSHAREEYESPSGIIGYRGPEEPPKSKWYNHMPAELIRQQIGTEIWNSYFKFASSGTHSRKPSPPSNTSGETMRFGVGRGVSGFASGIGATRPSSSGSFTG
jgi:hypothetical protein